MNRSVRILIVVIPLGAISVAAGFTAYHFIHSLNTKRPEQVSPAIEKQVPKDEWPDVTQLSSSGLPSISTEQLLNCKRTLNLPNEVSAVAHPSNFGRREPLDAIGRSIPNQPSLIVLHETVIPAVDTVRLFMTNHQNDNSQASYHMLISRGGKLIRIVPDKMRAYGSGYSRFGDFTVYSKSPQNFSINNVALHISLESPPNSQDGPLADIHYTREQYSTLAKQVLLWQAEYKIPIFRLTTHASVDRSHSRYDPRGLVWYDFDQYHKRYATMCSLDYLTLPSS
jgi:hypothetical protein